jgi:nucleoside 2-deoxyribosyltransferase
MTKFENGRVYSRPKVYLAGGMEHAEGWGQSWREEFTPWLESLGFEVFNPYTGQEDSTGYSMEGLRELKESSMEEYHKVMTLIVSEDLRELSKCEAVVCYLDESILKGAGTYGELTFCANEGIPVYALIDLPEGAKSLPGWCLGCITIYTEVKEEIKSIVPHAHILRDFKMKEYVNRILQEP